MHGAQLAQQDEELRVLRKRCEQFEEERTLDVCQIPSTSIPICLTSPFHRPTRNLLNSYSWTRKTSFPSHLTSLGKTTNSGTSLDHKISVSGDLDADAQSESWDARVSARRKGWRPSSKAQGNEGEESDSNPGDAL